MPDLQKKHEERIKNDAEFQELITNVNRLKESMDKNSISLNMEVRKKEKEEQEAKRLAIENRIRERQGLKLLKKGEVPQDNTKNDDPELQESGYILADYILMTIG